MKTKNKNYSNSTIQNFEKQQTYLELQWIAAEHLYMKLRFVGADCISRPKQLIWSTYSLAARICSMDGPAGLTEHRQKEL